MTKMICPKAGECENSHKAWSSPTGSHYGRCKPHARTTTCASNGFSYDKTCPPCIPYVRELKVGDRVRDTKRGVSGAIAPHAVGEKSVGIVQDGRFYKCEKEDLEYIGGEDMTEEVKYRALKPLTLRMLIGKASDVEMSNFAAYYLKWSTGLCLKNMDVAIPIDDRLIEYAKHKGCFWKFLTNGYIEETKSDYDRWVDEMPELQHYKEMDTRISLIEWAKRMPR